MSLPDHARAMSGGARQNIDLPVELQPPMANGEVIFSEPWQGRVFAMAVSLAERGVFEWSAMQAALIREIDRYDGGSDDDGAPYPYFELFAAALISLLRDMRVIDAARLDALTRTLAQRPHGHDH